MASIAGFEGDIEKDVEDVLHIFTSFEAKVAKAEPKVIAALGVLAGAANKVLSDVASAAAADGLNIALDAATVADLKASWADVTAFLATLGVKL